MNRFSLENKVIVITGASSGIGKVCAIECARMGALVIMLARDKDRLNAVLDEIKEFSDLQHLLYSVDLAEDLEILGSIVDEAVSIVGKIDGFLHAAGIEKTLPIGAMKMKDYESIFKINE